MSHAEQKIQSLEVLDHKTPSEACGITIEGQNKWKTLIENTSKIDSGI